MASVKPELIELIDRAAAAAGSQAKAAKTAGLQPAHVSNFRNGKKEPPPEAIAALAHVAGLDAVEWLARATLWRCEGKPYEQALRSGLGKRLQAIGGAVASCLLAVGLAFFPSQETKAQTVHNVYYVKLMWR